MRHLVGGISSAGRALPQFGNQSMLIDRAAGPYLWTDSGDRYIDTAVGFGATMLGHNVPEVVEAVARTQQRMMMPAFAHALEEDAAAALAACTGPLSKVIFVNTGSEAVHLACRTARAATGKTGIAKFAAGYDGWYDQVAFGNAGSADAVMASDERPVRDGMALLRYNDFADVDRLFAENADLAAVLIEPVLANAGCIEPAPGYLKYVADCAHRHGALVILDEVLMGFRLHAGLAGHLFGIEADMATVGKAIGSGVPVAALVGQPSVMQHLESGAVIRAGTYSGNPPVCAAVLATMRLLREQDYTTLLARGDAVRAAITARFAEAGQTIATSGYGTVFTLWPAPQAPVDYAQAATFANNDWTRQLHFALRDRHVLTMPFAFGRVYLSFAHTTEVMTQLTDAYADAAIVGH
ncbi:glutamate-1-semialdehyde aminotransferase [Robbsia andropogonis]|uniref:Glutamate-1-semialdehyde aminotransferase n=1 Tax=Robbsia andropogonis TaxID=28092 RepID=A0A0F5K3J9_9BURK|nr:aminotransferase class III-fold pyridoxal phosphate-dependent enzyme [Robbsia andropogonis]KKB64696.1 glutamate-1-semialdehyde aminotransferase [Robbsia andropogonis]